MDLFSQPPLLWAPSPSAAAVRTCSPFYRRRCHSFGPLYRRRSGGLNYHCPVLEAVISTTAAAAAPFTVAVVAAPSTAAVVAAPSTAADDAALTTAPAADRQLSPSPSRSG